MIRKVRRWLDGVEPAWTLLTFDSLLALRQEPSTAHTTIRISNNLGAEEIAGSAVARNTFLLLRQAIECGRCLWMRPRFAPSNSTLLRLPY